MPAAGRRALRLPRSLPEGGVLGVWTPSAPAPALFPRRYNRALDAVRAAGYEVVTASATEDNAGIAAAHPARLAEDLHELLRDDRVDAVVAATGGYTSATVLPYLDWDLIRAARRPIVGYSDVTSVLWAALAQAGLVTFHGPMIVSEWGEWGGPWPYTLDHFRRALTPQPGPTRLVPPPEWTDESLWWDAEDDRPRATRPGGWRCLSPGTAEGWLLPGCAATASHLIGTPFLPDPDGAILCLEFQDAGPDAVWAHLTQWQNAGLLDRIAGLVIGRHARPRAAAAGSDDVDAVVRAVLGRRRLPVLVDVDFGHTEPRLTLPVGGRALLDATHCGLTLPHDSTRS